MAEKSQSVQWVINNILVPNLATKLDETDLAKIGRDVVFGYELDLASRKEWEEKAEVGLKIARQITETKTYPWKDAANVKYPLIATAAIQFAARAYPQVIQGQDVVKASIIGKVTQEKESRARRVGMHMSYQLLEQMPEWEGDTDQLLTSLPVVGMYFRKTYRDTLLKRNVSYSVNPMDFVVNQKIKNLETSRRHTEKLYLYKNDVIERERADLFLDKTSDVMEVNDEEDKQELFLEQHTWLDLDKDGYKEPYVVTVHHESSKVARIVARYDEEGITINKAGQISKIEPVMYYTDFGFLPDPAGNYYKLGFAHLLGPINETINTAINQLLDSGHLANVQGGFIGSGVRLKGGALRVKPGEWIPADAAGSALKDNIVPFPVKEPSHVLFQLLGLLTETGMKLAAVSETMTGEVPGQNTPATTVLAMIEQGLKVFTSIYKRVFRSLKSEYRKLYRLNSIYMDQEEYVTILDDQEAVTKHDYSMKDLDIVPVADPTISSEAQRLARAQAILNAKQLNPTKGGQIETLRYYYDAIGVPDMDRFLPPKEVEAFLTSEPPPDPKLIEAQAKVIQMQAQTEFDKLKSVQSAHEAIARIELILAQVEATRASGVKSLADANKSESQAVTDRLDSLTAHLESLRGMLSDQIEANAQAAMNGEGGQPSGEQQDAGSNGGNEQGGVSGMEGAPDNGEVPEISPEDQGLLAGGSPEGANLESELSGANSPQDLARVGQDIRNQYNSGSSVG